MNVERRDRLVTVLSKDIDNVPEASEVLRPRSRTESSTLEKPSGNYERLGVKGTDPLSVLCSVTVSLLRVGVDVSRTVYRAEGGRSHRS